MITGFYIIQYEILILTKNNKIIFAFLKRIDFWSMSFMIVTLDNSNSFFNSGWHIARSIYFKFFSS